ncbi:MAG: dethiobiotin synthase [Gammaproteobacteria bacterium]|jgi:dethiobiotin synthetase|nr:dethiobiotin synthase [Gammaproteobacteria bacterium]
MGKTFFITGTDTDTGKTFVSCSLLQSAKIKGLSTAVLKPVAAGGILSNEGLQNEDAISLQESCTLNLSYKEINPLCLEQAIAPHIAAQKEGVLIQASELADHCKKIISKKADLTLIEGAGGWQVPLNQNEFMGDIVKILDIPVILVVGMKLGCLNHALLTVKAIKEEGVLLHGWIANQLDPLMPAYDENIDALKQKIEAPLIASIPWAYDIESGIVPIDSIL